MKNIILTIALFTVIPFTVATAGAQCSPSLRAEIPFDFVLNNKEIRAGSYTLSKADCNTANPLVVLRDNTGRFIGIVNRSAVPIDSPNAHEPASMVFARYGDSYFLTEVRAPSANFSFQLRPGKHELLLARSSDSKQVSVPVGDRKK